MRTLSGIGWLNMSPEQLKLKIEEQRELDNLLRNFNKMVNYRKKYGLNYKIYIQKKWDARKFKNKLELKYKIKGDNIKCKKI